MQIKLTHIAPLLAAGAAAVAISAAPTATAEAAIVQSPGNAQISAQPGGVASEQAAQLQQPFGGDMGGLLFHHGGPHGGHR